MAVPSLITNTLIDALDKIQGMFSFGQILSQLSFAFLIVIFAFVIEILFLGWTKTSIYRLVFVRSQSARIDIGMFFICQTTLNVVIGHLMLLGGAYLIAKGLRLIIDTSIVLQMSYMVHFFAFFLAIDLADYWHHRVFHKVPILWTFHRFHHAATELNGITANRNHPVETAILSIFYAIPIALLSAPVEGILLVQVSRGVLAYIKHSELEWHWGRFGKYILQSPQAHRVHHSTNPAHYDKNFSVVFSFWDILFGSYCGDRTKIEKVGLSDSSNVQRGLVSDLCECYVNAYLLAKESVKKPLKRAKSMKRL